MLVNLIWALCPCNFVALLMNFMIINKKKKKSQTQFRLSLYQARTIFNLEQTGRLSLNADLHQRFRREEFTIPTNVNFDDVLLFALIFTRVCLLFLSFFFFLSQKLFINVVIDDGFASIFTLNDVVIDDWFPHVL
jgi:hypothetical protein